MFKNLDALGTMQAQLNELKEASDSFYKALQFGDTSLLRQHIGVVYYKQNNLKAALQQLEKADQLVDTEFTIADRHKEEFNHVKANIKRQIAVLYQEQNKITIANEYAKEQLKYLDFAKAHPSSENDDKTKFRIQRGQLNEQIVNACVQIAQNLVSAESLENNKIQNALEALQMVDKAFEVEKEQGSNQATAELFGLRAQAQKQSEQVEEAIVSYNACLNALEKDANAQYDEVAAVLMNLGIIYSETKQFDLAKKYYDMIRDKDIEN